MSKRKHSRNISVYHPARPHPEKHVYDGNQYKVSVHSVLIEFLTGETKTLLRDRNVTYIGTDTHKLSKYTDDKSITIDITNNFRG